MSRKLVSLILAMLMLISMIPAVAESSAIVVTDVSGKVIRLDEPATRIVALTPAECEILYALGCEDLLVGRGEYCDYPESVLDFPALATGDQMNIEEILILEPQIVLLADQQQMSEQVKLLEQNGIQVVGGNTTDIQGVYAAIRVISSLIGKEAAGETLIADMQNTFDQIESKAEKSEKTIYFEVMPLQWGLWTAGAHTFMDELARICGMKNAFGDIADWQPISQEQVIERDPDYIVLVTGMGATAPEEVMSRSGWQDVKAVQNQAIYNADFYMMTRPGPRLKDAALGLYEFLYGDQDQ